MSGVTGASRAVILTFSSLLASSVALANPTSGEVGAANPPQSVPAPILSATAEAPPPPIVRATEAATDAGKDAPSDSSKGAASTETRSPPSTTTDEAAKAASDDQSATPAIEGEPPSDFKEEPKDEPAVVEKPVEAPAPTDPVATAIAGKLDETKLLLPRLPVTERVSMKNFYATGAFKPIWIADRAYNAAAKSIISRLAAAGEDALDPKAYPVPALAPSMTDAEIADADLKLSAAALLYARDARGGRINFARISALITPKLDLPSAEALLPQLVAADDKAGDTLQRYNPQTFGYLALKRRLTPVAPSITTAPLTTSTVASGEPRQGLRVPLGPLLKVGMSDPRVPALRSYLGLPERMPGTLDAPAGEPNAYDQGVADAIATFQRSRDLPASGNLTRATIVALAMPDRPGQQADRDLAASSPEPMTGLSGQDADLIVNMERWRWLPGDLGANYVLVNVPEYRLRVVRDGVIRDETRVIVGKTITPTPLFSGLMEFAVVNPSWYVPPSILKTMSGTGGFEVIGSGKNIGLRQPPGPRNALGYIKFMFPNRHAVYLHDTPNRGLFSASKRAMSHGCVRVDDPFRFAGAVMKDWSSDRLRKMIGRGERTIHFSEKLPVHLAYFTAYEDDHGTYRNVPDIYGYDSRMRTALGLSGGGAKVANAPVEPKREAASLEGMAARAAVPAPPRTATSPRVSPRVEPAPRQAQRPVPREDMREPVRREATREPVRRPAPVRRAPEPYAEPSAWNDPGRGRGFWW